MRAFSQNESLTDAQFGRLGDFLGNCKGGNAMNVEQLDGFFAVLVAGPGTVMPSEYYPEVFGGEMSDTCEFGALDEANEILGLVMRHWNTIAATLHKGEVYAPFSGKTERGWPAETTGLRASCGACGCGMTAGLSWSMTRSTVDA
jgi:yecA family protein